MSEIVMFVVRIPLLIVPNEIFEIFRKEERVVIDFAKPFGSIRMMLVHIHPRSPHFLPDVTTNFLKLHSVFIGFVTIVPRAGHVDENDIFGKCSRRKGGVVEISALGIVDDFISLQFTPDDGIGEEVDGVAALAPRGHDDFVEISVPYEWDHAVHSVLWVFVVISLITIVICSFVVDNTNVAILTIAT